MQSVAEVAHSIARFGERYVRRLYTDHEVESCGGVRPEAAPGLTARFAAKEATIKLLRVTDEVPTWRDIEVRRQPGGWCELSLGGLAALLADRAGLQNVSLSMSRSGGTAIATVVALCLKGAQA
jgi:holo-[acyl-carrier protein] synthase